MQKVQNTTGICYITLNGQRIKIRFGIPACRSISELLITDTTGIYFSEGKLSEVGIAKLIHFGYINDCIVAEIEQAYDFATFVEWVEDKALNNDLTEVSNVAQTWAESRITKKMLADVSEAVDDTKKKRRTGKK